MRMLLKKKLLGGQVIIETTTYANAAQIYYALNSLFEGIEHDGG